MRNKPKLSEEDVRNIKLEYRFIWAVAALGAAMLAAAYIVSRFMGVL